jgi:hypothetical protein
MKSKGAGLDPSDAIILTHALVEGMAKALPGFSALNVWFKSLAKATMDKAKDDVGLEKSTAQIRWMTPAGSVINQEYYMDDEYSVATYSYGDTKVDRYVSYKEKNTKELKKSKMQTALAANTVHSLDAALLQLALHDYEGTAYTTVHDCVYGPSGTLGPLVDRIKDAFYKVVCDDFLSSMILTNNLQDHESLEAQLHLMTHEDNGLLDSIKDSKYLFS